MTSLTSSDIINKYFKFCEIKECCFWRAVTAELLGTGILVFIGCGSILPAEHYAVMDPLIAPAICFGFIIATLVHLIGPTSGCHINPAMTLTLAVAGRCPLLRSCFYIIAQLIGASLGALLLWLISPDEYIASGKMGRNCVNALVTPMAAMIMESIITCILALVVLLLTDPKEGKHYEGTPAYTAGFVVSALVFCAGPYSGASLNPARSFGPALIAMDFENFWVFVTGPCLGALLAVIFYQLILKQGVQNTNSNKNSQDHEDKLNETST